jgi:hypothetical protein
MVTATPSTVGGSRASRVGSRVTPAPGPGDDGGDGGWVDDDGVDADGVADGGAADDDDGAADGDAGADGDGAHAARRTTSSPAARAGAASAARTALTAMTRGPGADVTWRGSLTRARGA